MCVVAILHYTHRERNADRRAVIRTHRHNVQKKLNHINHMSTNFMRFFLGSNNCCCCCFCSALLCSNSNCLQYCSNFEQIAYELACICMERVYKNDFSIKIMNEISANWDWMLACMHAWVWAVYVHRQKPNGCHRWIAKWILPHFAFRT